MIRHTPDAIIRVEKKTTRFVDQNDVLSGVSVKCHYLIVSWRHYMTSGIWVKTGETLDQVMARCREATSHYLIQCWQMYQCWLITNQTKKEHIAMNCYLKLNKEKCITGPFVTGGSLTKGQQCGKRPHVTNELSIFHDNFFNMITSSHGNAFRVTSLLWGGTLRSRVYSPHKRPAARSLDVFFGVEP